MALNKVKPASSPQKPSLKKRLPPTQKFSTKKGVDLDAILKKHQEEMNKGPESPLKRQDSTGTIVSWDDDISQAGRSFCGTSIAGGKANSNRLDQVSEERVDTMPDF